MKISLNYGSTLTYAEIPEKNYMDTLDPIFVEEQDDPVLEVKRAINNPIGSPALKELVSPGQKAVIIASDISRPVPSHILLPPILEELNKGNVKDNQINVVFGLGIHRKHTEEEKKKLVGQEVYNRVLCIDHDIDDCKEIGKTKRGNHVSVSRKILESDFIIATGNLEFHYHAGFSGGAKAVAPGVCNRETIIENHRHLLDPNARSGQIKGNPVREEIEEIGSMVGIDFMVNAILNGKNRIIRVVAGDVTAAHKEGVKFINSIFRREINELADIVVVSPGGFPKDINLYQAHKAVENASQALKKGGILILAAECRESLGDLLFAEALTEGTSPFDLVEEFKHRFVLGRHAASRMAKIHVDKEIFIVSDLPVRIREKLFFKSFSSVDSALDKALEVKGSKARVLVIPFGVSTLPFYFG